MKKITLDRPAEYEIRVSGIITENLLDWNGRLTIDIESNLYPEPVSILTVALDQAELHGLLRHLYGFGIPLISVVCKEYLASA
jgi:hypothetical protein